VGRRLFSALRGWTGACFRLNNWVCLRPGCQGDPRVGLVAGVDDFCGVHKHHGMIRFYNNSSKAYPGPLWWLGCIGCWCALAGVHVLRCAVGIGANKGRSERLRAVKVGVWALVSLVVSPSAAGGDGVVLSPSVVKKGGDSSGAVD
jgi:hypothetical protein